MCEHQQAVMSRLWPPQLFSSVHKTVLELVLGMMIGRSGAIAASVFGGGIPQGIPRYKALRTSLSAVMPDANDTHTQRDHIGPLMQCYKQAFRNRVAILGLIGIDFQCRRA